MTDRLFDVGPRPDTPTLSADARRTQRNQALLEAGKHPATLVALRGEGTCGSCVHAVKVDRGATKPWKCDVHRLGMSFSAASDIRVSWPACVRYEPREAPGVST